LALPELLLLAETFEAALGLLVATTLTGAASEELSLDESLLDSTFLTSFFCEIKKY
jgi:hypothetical protein